MGNDVVEPTECLIDRRDIGGRQAHIGEPKGSHDLLAVPDLNIG
jgi:hypothetical protein